MEAMRVQTLTDEEGKITISAHEIGPNEPVEVILLKLNGERRAMTAKDLLESDLVGVWADRDDIGDSVEYARELRRRAEANLRGR